MKLKPVEDFVLEGFAKRYYQIFNARPVYVTAFDKAKAIEKTFEGTTPTYPLGVLTVQTLTQNIESRNTMQLARRGIPSIVDESGTYSVRLMPATFEIEVEYRTLSFNGSDDSVLRYVKRWLFSRRIGSLKFNVDYGRLTLPIDVTLSDNVQIPLRESSVETDTCYKIVTMATIKGYISEAELAQQGIVQDLIVNGLKLNADGSLTGAQFIPFSTKL